MNESQDLRFCSVLPLPSSDDHVGEVTYMLLAIIAHARNPHFAFQHGIFQSLPTAQPSFLSAIRTVQQE
jgi:hypothetical protein